LMAMAAIQQMQRAQEVQQAQYGTPETMGVEQTPQPMQTMGTMGIMGTPQPTQGDTAITAGKDDPYGYEEGIEYMKVPELPWDRSAREKEEYKAGARERATTLRAENPDAPWWNKNMQGGGYARRDTPPGGGMGTTAPPMRTPPLMAPPLPTQTMAQPQSMGSLAMGMPTMFKEGGAVGPPMSGPESGPQEAPLPGGDQTYYKPAMEQLDMDQYEYAAYVEHGPDMYKWMAPKYKSKQQWTPYDAMVDAGTIDPYEIDKDELNVVTNDQLEALSNQARAAMRV